MPVIDPFSVDADWSSQRSPVRFSTGYHSLNGVALENAPDWSGFVLDGASNQRNGTKLIGTVAPASRDAFFAALDAGAADVFPAVYTTCVTKDTLRTSSGPGYVYKTEFHQPFGHLQPASVAARHVIVASDITWSYSGSDPAMVGTFIREGSPSVPQLGYVLWPDELAIVCSRLYFSSDTTGIPSVTRDASWDFNGGDHGMTGYVGLLKPSPASSRNGANSWQVGTVAVPLGFSHGQFFYQLSGSGTLSGTVKAMMRAARNSGVGVTGSQIHQAQMVMRIVSSDGSTVRGTLLSSHEPVSADSTAWTSTTTSRKFPAGALWGATGAPMSSVSYQNGDWVVVEYGTWTTVDGAGTGASIYQNDQAGAAGDLPEDETTTTNLRSWIDFCTPGGLP